MKNPQIIYEGDEYLIINKPPGFIVNEAKTTKNQPVIQTWLKENFDYEIVESRQCRSGIVHRIDKETSGILIIAKTEKSFVNLQKQFKERKVKKTYKALVHGKVEIKKGNIMFL